MWSSKFFIALAVLLGCSTAEGRRRLDSIDTGSLSSTCTVTAGDTALQLASGACSTDSTEILQDFDVFYLKVTPDVANVNGDNFSVKLEDKDGTTLWESGVIEITDDASTSTPVYFEYKPASTVESGATLTLTCEAGSASSNLAGAIDVTFSSDLVCGAIPSVPVTQCASGTITGVSDGTVQDAVSVTSPSKVAGMDCLIDSSSGYTALSGTVTALTAETTSGVADVEAFSVDGSTATSIDSSTGLVTPAAGLTLDYISVSVDELTKIRVTVEPTTSFTEDVKITCYCYYSGSQISSGGGDDDDEDPCFSSESTVDVLGQGRTTMVDLKAGDMVRTHSGDYEAILGFTHYAPNTMGEFKQFFMENSDKPLEMTGNHLVYKSGESAPVAASSLIVGDRLVTSSGDASITKIDTIMREGLYTPMTASGDVVVDGIKASNYVQLQDNGSNYATFANGMSTGISQHQGIHMFAAPFRMLCQNGFSSVCNSYNEKGYLSWVDSGIKLAKFANEQSFFVQIAMLMLALLVFAPIYGIELVGLPAVAAMAMGAAVWRSSGLSFRVSKAKSA